MATLLHRAFATRLTITASAPALRNLNASRVVAVNPLALPTSSFATASALTPAARKRQQAQAAKEKERAAKLKEKEKAKLAKEQQRVAREKERAKERLAKQKEREKAKAAKLKPWELLDAEGNKVPLPTESRPTASTPWIVFVTRKHQQHKAQSQGADSPRYSPKEMMKQYSREWHAMTADEKRPFEDESRRQVAEKAVKMEEWNASLTAQDRARLAAYNRFLAKSGKRTKNIARDPKKPTKPVTAFFRFLQSQREAYNREGLSSITDIAKRAGEEWKKMSESDKEPFEAATQAEMPSYKAAMDEYLRSTRVPK